MEPALIVAIAAAAVSLGAAVATWWEARSAHLLRRDTTEPYLWADIRPSAHAGELLQLVVGNTGYTVATEVRVEFSPPLRSTALSFKTGRPAIALSSLTPGREFRWNLDIGASLFKSDLPKSYAVRINGSGPYGPLKERSYIINLQEYAESSGVTEGTLHEISRSVRELNRTMKEKWRT